MPLQHAGLDLSQMAGLVGHGGVLPEMFFNGRSNLQVHRCPTNLNYIYF